MLAIWAKIGTEVAHVTRDSDTTFKVKSSKVNLLMSIFTDFSSESDTGGNSELRSTLLS